VSRVSIRPVPRRTSVGGVPDGSPAAPGPQRLGAPTLDRLPRAHAAEVDSAPRWSAPRGRRDELLDDLKAGRSVIVGSATLLCAMMAAELPEATYRRFCYGGPDYKKQYLLDGDRLTAWVDDG
jgi:hypothetical protein